MKTILVIEPDRIFKENLVELLELEGYLVKSASTVWEAEIITERFNPSIIICDEDLLKEEFGALDVYLKKVHKITPAKIIVIDGAEEKFEEADAYLKMPFRDDELISKLNTLLAAKKSA